MAISIVHTPTKVIKTRTHPKYDMSGSFIHTIQNNQLLISAPYTSLRVFTILSTALSVISSVTSASFDAIQF